MDAVILFGYLLLMAFKRNAVAFWPLAAWSAVIIFTDVSSDISTVYSFVQFSLLYILLAAYLTSVSALIAGVVATYYLIFALDSWLYAEQKTWIWVHNEYIVAFLHLSLMLSISHSGKNLVVAVCFYLRSVYADLPALAEYTRHTRGGKEKERAKQ